MWAQQIQSPLCPRNPGWASLAGAIGSAMGGAGVGPMGMVKSGREAGDVTQHRPGMGGDVEGSPMWELRPRPAQQADSPRGRGREATSCRNLSSASAESYNGPHTPYVSGLLLPRLPSELLVSSLSSLCPATLLGRERIPSLQASPGPPLSTHNLGDVSSLYIQHVWDLE